MELNTCFGHLQKLTKLYKELNWNLTGHKNTSLNVAPDVNIHLFTFRQLLIKTYALNPNVLLNIVGKLN